MLEKITQKLMEATITGSMIAGSFMPLPPIIIVPYICPESQLERVSKDDFSELYRKLDNIPIREWEGQIAENVQGKFVEYGSVNHLITREKTESGKIRCSLYIDEKKDVSVDYFGVLEIPEGIRIFSTQFPLQKIKSMDQIEARSIQFLYGAMIKKINSDFEKQ
mgnify:CR=1 FL=1